MKKKLLQTLALGTAAIMIVGGVIGCGSSNDTSTEDTSQETTAESAESAEAGSGDSAQNTTDLSGSLSLAGSTSMEKLCEALSEGFMQKYPGVTVTVEYTGSSAGIESLIQGSVDIGDASRSLEDGETESGAVENVVAIDGIAVITDPANPVSDLTTEQLVSIYKGEITNWSELGGDDEAIVVIGREAGSGTRGAFEELLEIEDACNYAQELDSTGAVLAKVASTPGSIGYVSLDAVDDSVLSMTLDSVAATEENITAGDYALSRPFVMATMGEITEQNELVQAWFDYISSEEGSSVVTGVGLILPE
ncbi:MAG: phosphate ABC transporter substrate-binding protein [Eubacterium sp.]|nr:phosphate ABC transporter substrate-binding protein [Eubacterium sp.]